MALKGCGDVGDAPDPMSEAEAQVLVLPLTSECSGQVYQSLCLYGGKLCIISKVLFSSQYL